MEIIKPQNNNVLKTAFNECNYLQTYWNFSEIDFKGIKSFANIIITIIGSKNTYSCEQTFSIVKYWKYKYYSRLSDKHLNAVLRISTSNVIVDINKLVENIQPHKRHWIFLYFSSLMYSFYLFKGIVL